jgi:GNAT superfamily N-acetyltransferase
LVGVEPTVREPVVTDADALGAIHVRAWQAAYRNGLMPDDYLDALSAAERAEMWRTALSTPPRTGVTRLVAEVDAKVVGFALVGPDTDDGAFGELYALNVDPDRWGLGAGASLLAAGVDALRSAGFHHAVLWVHPGNDRARAFYAAHGWIDDGRARPQEVLGVEVPEVRMSIDLIDP